MTVIWTNRFKREYDSCIKRGLDIQKLDDVIKKLSKNEPLPSQYHDHFLQGDYKGFRECHIQPDWLLIYKIDNNKVILVLSRTGSHSDLFKH